MIRTFALAALLVAASAPMQHTTPTLVRRLVQQEWIDGLALSSNGLLAIADRKQVHGLDSFLTEPSSITVWDSRAGKSRLVLKPGQPVNVLCFSPNGRVLVAGSVRGQLELWDVLASKRIRVLQAGQAVKALDFSPDGALLAAAAADGFVTLWNANTGKSIRRFRSSRNYAFAVAFSSDGKILATGGDYNGTVKLWEVKSGRLVRTMKAHKETVDAIAFSRDGSLMVTGSWDDTARIWEARASKLLHRLEGHSFNVWSVAISADSDTLATISSELMLWDTRSGKRIAMLPENGGHVAFSPTGIMLAASSEGSVSLWRVAPRSNGERADGVGPTATSIASGT